ncbi:hypothetical protein ACNKHQ_17905 [Shigella flexneri]
MRKQSGIDPGLAGASGFSLRRKAASGRQLAAGLMLQRKASKPGEGLGKTAGITPHHPALAQA